MKKIIHFARIHAAPETVYRALTTASGLAGWWSTQVKVEGGVGGAITFHFTGDFNPTMQVMQLSKDRNVLWRCVAGHDNWKDNTFIFDLQPVNGETGLKFVQEYAQELSDEVYGTYNFNWGYYLGSLKRLCEEGQGTPFGATAKPGS